MPFQETFVFLVVAAIIVVAIIVKLDAVVSGIQRLVRVIADVHRWRVVARPAMKMRAQLLRMFPGMNPGKEIVPGGDVTREQLEYLVENGYAVSGIFGGYTLREWQAPSYLDG